MRFDMTEPLARVASFGQHARPAFLLDATNAPVISGVTKSQHCRRVGERSGGVAGHKHHGTQLQVGAGIDVIPKTSRPGPRRIGPEGRPGYQSAKTRRHDKPG